MRVAKMSTDSEDGTPWQRPWAWLPTMEANQGAKDDCSFGH